MRSRPSFRSIVTAFVSALLSTQIILATQTVTFAQAPAPAPGGNPEIPAYKDLDARSGVFNDGQSALWDLHILDHYLYFGPESRARGYRPEQPIAFSHVTHVQQNKMDCQYCHWNVAKSSYAAIPEVQTCMGCHKIVGGRKDPTFAEKGKANEDWQINEIKKIREYWDKGQPIPWVKVHVMPAHVNFNHKRHVKAGVSCQECHGMIPKMQVVERVSSMKMGWCIDCHRQKGSSIDCTTCHK
jgi:hypothetical protein